jgi:hypothetical protein
MVDSIINLALLLSAVVCLIFGAFQDLKTREVIDWVWILMIGVGSFINVLQFLILLFDGKDISNFLAIWFGNIFMALLLGLILTISGMGGEADRIAFVAIAFVTPYQEPFLSLIDPNYQFLFSLIPKVLGTFFNSYLLGIFIPIAIFCYNIFQRRTRKDYYALPPISFWKKAGLYLVGYPRLTKNIKEELKIKPWHFDFLEEYNDESGWEISYRLRLDTPEEDLARKKNTVKLIEEQEKEVIWIQPTLPFIVFIFFGFVLN